MSFLLCGQALRALSVACWLTLALAAAPALAAEAADPHAHHQGAAGNKLKRSTADYRVPSVKMVRADGKDVDLADELGDARPVMLNFIYTTCTAICPMMTYIFADMQERLGPESAKIHVVSVSIDPEHDTPSRLRDYATRYQAKANWDFYTGSAAASITVQKAFAAYRGDKMNHEALSLIRKAPGQPWLRVEGLATPDELLAIYRDLLAVK